MKKKVSIILSVLLAVTVLGVGIYKSDASQGEPKLSQADIEQIVENQYSGKITGLELVKDFNQATYHANIVSDDLAYELQLDGNTGEILYLKEAADTTNEEMELEDPVTESKVDPENEEDKLEKESSNEEDVNETKEHHKHHDKMKNKDKHQQHHQKSDKTTVIDAKQAIDIALQEFPGTIVELELEREDGRLIYEIEIENGEMEAEIEIDAYTGEIIVIELDD